MMEICATVPSGRASIRCYDRCSSFRVSSVFYTKRLFQTAHGKMAESRMGEEEACLNQKLEEKI